MSEENQSTQPPEVSLSTKPQSTLVKDLMIPISIIIAGIFVGAGMYFGGSTPTGVTAGEGNNEPENPLAALVASTGVDEDDFAKCFEAGETLSAVQEDIDNAIETGGRGTPWGIVIGPTGKKYPLNGAIPQQAIEQLIEVARSDSAPAAQDEETAVLNKMTPVSSDDHIKGSVEATVTIVEYSDFDCPFCTRFHGTMNNIVSKYSGDDVAWVYRHFPLEQLHPQAKAVAVASECVAKLGGNEAFWTFADGYLSE